MAVIFSAMRAGCALPSRKILGTHIYEIMSQHQNLSAAGKIGKSERFNYVIGNPSGDLPVVA
jgi:hypothetical protein